MNAVAATATAEAGRRQAVVVDGITWKIHSRNERSATVNGRHLFAFRCNSTRPWALVETDRPLGSGMAREIAQHGTCDATRDLTTRAKAIPSVQFYRVVKASVPSYGRDVLHVMSPAGVLEATFYGEQYRDRADGLAASLNDKAARG